MQKRIKALTEDPSTPTPGHPRFVANDAEADAVQKQFGVKIKEILSDELTKLKAANEQWDRTTHSVELPSCRLPEILDEDL